MWSLVLIQQIHFSSISQVLLSKMGIQKRHVLCSKNGICAQSIRKAFIGLIVNAWLGHVYTKGIGPWFLDDHGHPLPPTS